MTTAPPGGGRRCAFCRGLLGADRDAGVCVCSPCQRDRRDYDPACDPVFDRILEELFLTHPRKVIDPVLMLAVPRRFKWSVNTSIRRLRRRGMCITGVPHTGGYVYEPAKATTPARVLRGRRRA